MAARKELLDQAASPDECEKLYEESLWCLYALQDDLLQTGNPFMEEDRATIATCMFDHLPLLFGFLSNLLLTFSELPLSPSFSLYNFL
jgi:hypothetical protein